MRKSKEILVDNLIALRKERELTQSELGQLVGYSDKAVSRWERGESIPDVDTLEKIAEIFKVPFVALFTEKAVEKRDKNEKRQTLNKIIVSALAVIAVWFLATLLFVYSTMSGYLMWEVFILAVPVSCVVLIIFICLWGKRIHFFITLSVFLWTTIAYVYIRFLDYSFWAIFLVGIPLQVGIILFSNIKTRKQ